MRAIIAGGRDFLIGPRQRRWLDGVNAVLGIHVVVSGCAPGADAGGEEWADSRGIAVQRFPADWERYGRSAGPRRNQQMADYCDGALQDACILFPGGAGTASMRRIATARGLRVVLYQDKETP